MFSGVLVLCVFTGGPVSTLGATGDESGSSGPSPESSREEALWGWLDAPLRERLRAGEEVPIEEIDGFPYTAREHARHLQSLEAESCSLGCPALPYTHIRPGAALGLSQLACTANFVFENGDRLAIGTAGHCTVEGARHQTLLVNAQHAVGFRTVGGTEFSTGSASSLGNDFALIEIDPRYHHLVDPAVSVLDGPCGWRTGRSGDPVQYYGHAQGWGPGGQPRSGSVLNAGDASLSYTRFHSGGGGDSGSPVVFAGVPGSSQWREAAAVHTHGVSVVVGLPLGFGTSMPRVFEILEEAGETGWDLVDSPNCP